MGNNFTVFESAVSALGANSHALSVTSQNIANVNTPGYSRQQIILKSAKAQTIGGIELGRGVTVASVERIFNDFAELKLRNSTTENGESQTEASILGQVESIFNELSGEGMAEFISDFFNAYSDVANDPSETAPRENLLNAASRVINRFHDLDSQLTDNRTLIDLDIQDQVSKINSLTSQIYDFNLEIQQSDDGAQVLKDQRLVAVRELAELIDVQVVDSTSGTFQVYASGGLLLVSSKTSATLSTAPNASNDNLLDIRFAAGSSTALDITSRIAGGSLKGLLDTRDTDIPAYTAKLDEMAYEFATEINTLHSAGYNLNSATTVDFFGTLASATDAARLIALDAAVDGTPAAIAASDTAANVPGGNAVALQIAALQGTSITFTSGSSTFTGFYGDLLSDIGVDYENALNTAEFTQGVLTQAEVKREQISGVSIEEEQLNLIRYQSAFQASAQLVSIATDILDRLVELGR